jgi:peptidoglycan-associated lipoprotein
MMNMKILGALGAIALLSACSSDEATNAAATGAGGSGGLAGAGMGSARPGSQEDLVANVGDRVFLPTSAAPASTTSPSASAAPTPRATCW